VGWVWDLSQSMGNNKGSLVCFRPNAPQATRVNCGIECGNLES
jgi:hypothetical protein